MRAKIAFIVILGQLSVTICGAQAQTPKAKPIFRSELISTSTPGHAVNVDLEIGGLKQLFLVVDDGGNGYSHDWASWAEPKLIGQHGELALSELSPFVATAGYGSVQMNRNCSGQPIQINGHHFDRGIGTHANSVVGFELPPGYDRFTATAGLDEGGTGQAGGNNASVRFSIFSSAPPLIETPGGDRDPQAAVEKLDVGEGLEATLFAAEPELLSLTNLDIDHRGRVWVCEVVNYRGHNGKRPEGDRILICSDTDGDGICDETKVYYQGRDIDSAMGICVLGNRVIVSCSPNIWVFTDENGDDRPDRKEVLFSNTGSHQHDHAAHSFVFGPDGKLYWNFGNEGHAVHDATGNLVKDLHGQDVTDRGQPYWGGMVFRCNLDGSEMEVLAHNFRNNYEAAVDSFGGIWQSDNDDDGNRGVRINFVMEYGNFGYLDERTGAGWQSPRTALEAEIPQRHWHQNDPGVVPNLVVTGAGSPTGITVYEGTLLPERFWNQVIHCDAGPNVVRSYPVIAKGAGYEVAEVNNVLHGARDNWFRPADVCVAPDGSLFVSDWYDPGVGGHAMGDLTRGRLFRVAPPDSKYLIPEFDFSRPDSAAQALKNPCQSVRFLAWQALNDFGPQALPALQKLAREANPRWRARALWLLSQFEGEFETTLAQAARDPDENIRCQAVRMARHERQLLGKYLAAWVGDASPAVRRELAVALRDYSGPDVGKLWTDLAQQYDGRDRWYLEALGIAADGRWNECLAVWLSRVGENWNSRPGIDIIWRSRADQTSDLIAKILAQQTIDQATAMRMFRSLDFQLPARRDVAMRALAECAELLVAAKQPLPVESLLEIADRTPDFAKLNLPNVRANLVSYLNESAEDHEFVNWATRLRFAELAPRLLATILQSLDRNDVGMATRALIELGGRDRLQQCFGESAEAEQVAVVRGLNWSGAAESRALLQAACANANLSTLVRSEAIKALGQWTEGQKFVLQQVVLGSLENDLRFPAANILLTSQDTTVREEAAKYLTLPSSAENRPLPAMAQLLQMRGDSARGLEVFTQAGTCAKCHRVNGAGTEIGPDLSEVGSKLSSEAMYESILNPSAGISPNYEMYTALLSDGRILSGVLISKTADEVVLKDKEAVLLKISTNELDEFSKQQKSLMPDDLQKLLTEQQLIDVIEYLQSLKKQ